MKSHEEALVPSEDGHTWVSCVHRSIQKNKYDTIGYIKGRSRVQPQNISELSKQ
jgi:hypothetical protein